MECWNLGILEENTLGRDERLIVLGTQTRAPPRAAIRLPPTFRPSHLSAVGIAKADIPTFQFEVIDKRPA